MLLKQTDMSAGAGIIGSQVLAGAILCHQNWSQDCLFIMQNVLFLSHIGIFALL